MSDVRPAGLWIALTFGIVVCTVGALTLINRRVPVFWLRGRVRWNRWGWAAVMIGLGLALESIAWLDGVSSSRLFFFVSLAGLALFCSGLGLQAWAALPGAAPAAPDGGGWPEPS